LPAKYIDGMQNKAKARRYKNSKLRLLGMSMIVYYLANLYLSLWTNPCLFFITTLDQY